jgi:tRNA-dihydrouridine synthase A
MMDWTDRHCRVFHRTLSRRARLYTEMVTAEAVLHGDRQKLLGFDPVEHPVALQLGGCDPVRLAQVARIGRDFGYDEINLNVGCPSDRVQSGRFGACLMKDPQLVADCMAAMGEVVDVPVTVKCRIGVDDQDPATALFALVDACAAAGVSTFIVHARKAWLFGLSPKENRDVPPLDYGLVERLKRERPSHAIVLNGGITTLEQAERHLGWADGVMLGRAAYQTPGLLAEVDARLFGEAEPSDGFRAIEAYRPYLERAMASGTPFYAVARHMLGLFAGQPGARVWRRILTVEGVQAGAGTEVLDRALQAIVAGSSRLGSAA